MSLDDPLPLSTTLNHPSGTAPHAHRAAQRGTHLLLLRTKGNQRHELCNGLPRGRPIVAHVRVEDPAQLILEGRVIQRLGDSAGRGLAMRTTDRVLGPCRTTRIGMATLWL